MLMVKKKKSKLEWKEIKPGRIEADDFAVIILNTLDAYKYILYKQGMVIDFFKTKDAAKKKAVRLYKKDVD